eukprot:99297-Prorocentrum_minimum.AAC.1
MRHSRERKKTIRSHAPPSGPPRFGRFGRTHGSGNPSGVFPPLVPPVKRSAAMHHDPLMTPS